MAWVYRQQMIEGETAFGISTFERRAIKARVYLNLLKEMVNMWWSIGGGIIIFALGMFIFLKPGLIWKLTEEWKSYRADEPSEFYLKTTKIGGILFALFGIIMIMLPVILE